MPPDDTMSLAANRAIRRKQLSAAILDGFEMRGWQWTDDELVDGIKEIIQDHEKGYRESKQETSMLLRRKICRAFGESQVVAASDEVPATLAKQLGAEMKAAITKTGGDATKNVVARLSHRLLHQEIDGLSASKEIFPVFFAISFEPMFKALSQIIQGFHIVEDDCQASTAFHTVLWILAEAAKNVVEVGDMAAFVRKRDAQNATDDYSRYLEYRRAEAAAVSERAMLQQHLANLMPELRALIFKEIAVSTIHLYPGNRDVEDIADVFGNADFATRYLDSFPYSPDREKYRIAGTDEILDMYGEEIAEAVIPDQIERYHMEAPTDDFSHVGLLPPRAVLAARGPFVRALQLWIHIPRTSVRRPSYPLALINAQDNIANLRNWFPTLTKLDVEVDSYNRHQDSAVPFRTQDGLTTIHEELAKLVSGMLKLDVRSKKICYNQHYDYGYWNDSVKDNPDQEMTMESFFATFMKWEGLSLHPRSVGNGLADVRDAI